MTPGIYPGMARAEYERIEAVNMGKRILSIGGSTSAAAAGLSRYSSRHAAYARIMGLEPETPPNLAQRIGTHNEAFMAGWYVEHEFSKRNEFFLDRSYADFKAEPFRNPDYPFMHAHFDGLVLGTAVGPAIKGVEFKVAGLHTAKDWGDPEHTQVPQEYYIQCLHSMILAGVKTWDLVVMLGTDIKVYPLEYDEEAAAGLVLALRNFYEKHLLPGIPPEPDGSEDCKNLMGWLYEQKDDAIDFANDEELKTLRLLAEVHRNLEAEEGNYAELSNKTKKLIGSRAGLRFDGGKVTWRARKDGVRVFRVDFDEDAA